MILKRVRKALAAGIAAAGVAAGTALNNNGVPGDPAGWAGLAGLVVSAFLVAAVVTYAAPANAPQP